MKSVKRISSGISGKKILLDLSSVINTLAAGLKLNPKYTDHALQGEYAGFRECHIRANVLLVYKIEKEKMILILVELGSHSYLF